jgi:KDO2-lipid IV(A) lauroyltransferase
MMPPGSKSPAASPDALIAERGERSSPRWTLHGMNNGVIFSLMCGLVGALPRRLTYAVGDLSMWLAWRLMSETRAAVADNLQAIVPDESAAARRRRTLETFRSYARDVIDFVRAIAATDEEQRQLFDFQPEHARVFETLLAQGQGIILVSGHYGNWEIGSVLMKVFNLPLTIVAMAEANPEVNRRRRELRESLGADTIEVRKSLDTALQIRRRLGDNRIVAVLMDRHFGRDRVAVTLAGRRAWFLKTPALMGLLAGAPLVPCFIERTGPARFSATPGEPIFVDRALPREQAIQRAAQQFADQLNERLHAHPNYWYHFYRYWDSQRDQDDGPA